MADSRDDIELMRGIARGEPTALAALYDRHCDIVFAVCQRILKNRPEAEEILTDVFYEIWQRRERYNADRSRPLTYLLLLARSRSIDRKRGGRSPSIARPAIPSLDPPAIMLKDERRDRVRRALDELDPAQRQAVEFSFFDDLSHREIAAQLNKPLGTIKTLIRQGLIYLRERLRTTDSESS